MQTLFVYYKIPLTEHAMWQAKVLEFRERVLRECSGLEVELMQRPDASGEGLETWMEVYRHPQGVSAEISALISRLATEMGLPAKRACEIFVPLRS
jgi:hypothetical protein